MIGCMMETGIGIAAAAHVAASARNIVHADLDSDLLLEDHIVLKGGAPAENSVRQLGTGPGLGIAEVDSCALGAPVSSCPR